MDRQCGARWTWPVDAAQDPELLWDLPDASNTPPEPTVRAAVPGFLGDVPWGGVMRQAAPGEEDDAGEGDDDGLGATRERGRVMWDGRCLIDAVFAFNIYQRLPNGDHQDEGLVRWQCLQPEVGMPWNARLGARILVRDAQPMPGSATVMLSRSGPGPAIEDPTRAAYAATVADLRTAFARLREVVIESPAIPPGGSPVAEIITAVVIWTPEQGAPCRRMVEPVTVRWYRGRNFKVVLPQSAGARRGTHARTGRGVVPRGKGPDRQHVVPTEIFWAVDDPDGCCSARAGYSKIQFVRHLWHLNEQPPKDGRDAFTLDILDSEVARANAQPPLAYDPTFTHNPRGTDPAADPIVYPSPDGYGETAIAEIDEPGLPERLYERILEHGGLFAWQFVSLLVCAIEGGVADAYMASGRVEQELQWTLELRFGGRGLAPAVTATKRSGFPRKYRMCKPLSEVLDGLGLRAAYAHPRGHTIAVPAP